MTSCQKKSHLDALQFNPSLNSDQKKIINDVSSKDKSVIYISTVAYGDNLNSGDQKVNKTHFELNSNTITGNENEVKHTVMWWSVAIDGFWIGDSINSTL
jgi:hypothetical protein